MTDNSADFADDMAEYLQTFLDETEEQLDDLVETLLALERDPANANDLNEAFRLVHSIKGSAGMMGFDNITVLTHHLENRFERFRAGLAQLDQATMNLVLRCIDFLRQCNNRLREGQQLGSATDLLAELKRLEEQPVAVTRELDLVSEEQTFAPESSGPDASLLSRDGARDTDEAELCVVDMEYDEYSVQLQPGDRLYLYSDGVPEAMNESMEQFTFERMLEIVELGQTQTLDESVQLLLKSVKRWCAKKGPKDDVSLLGLEIVGEN